MGAVHYISLEEALEIHKLTITHSGGGRYEYLDTGRLDSVLTNIQNDDYYPAFVDKLTHLFFCTCQFHCFADGNKRLAITLSTQFLLKNGYLSIAKNFMEITENSSYQVSAGKIDKDLLHCIMDAILRNTYSDDEELKLAIFRAIC